MYIFSLKSIQALTKRKHITFTSSSYYAPTIHVTLLSYLDSETRAATNKALTNFMADTVELTLTNKLCFNQTSSFSRRLFR